MAWDFAEATPLGESSGSFLSAFDRTADALGSADVAAIAPATVQRADACAHPLPDASVAVWFTDPPYYDSVPYAHLSDFFHVWERRALDSGAKVPALTPKNEECVVDRPHSAIPDAKTAAHFERRVGVAMAEGARVTAPDGVACVVFAHKTTEGWEALLSGMLSGGWVITSSWPVATEMESRLNARDNASLTASVHLVCRPRPHDAPVGDWGDVLRELPGRVADWMERLQSEGVRGADLVFACIGPALEIFSRYAKAVDPAEREIPLGGDATAKDPHKRGYLTYVWEVVGRAALEQVLGTKESKARNGASGALEEDARLTALFLWTKQSTEVEEVSVNGEADAGEDDGEDEDEDKPKKKGKGFSLIFDVVRRFAQPLGIDLPKWEGRIIETEKGIVRLFSVGERAKQLFGADGADEIDEREFAAGVKSATAWLPGMEPEARPPKVRGRRIKISEDAATQAGVTTLDKVHAAMLLQSTGMTHALRALVKVETERGPDLLRLANSLSALYPKASDEKRLVDAMLLAVPK